MYYVNENIRNLYRIKFHDKRGQVLRLDMNENPTGLPEEFVEEVKKKITPSFIATYPEKGELEEIIAEHNNIKRENITLTAGSDEAMRLIFQCFGEPGKALLTVSPTFELYDVYSKMFGMSHITANYDEDFNISVQDIMDLMNKEVGIVTLLNPNSPIGNVFSLEEVECVIRKAQEIGSIVIIDEAYHYFYEKTFISLINQYDNVIVLRTFSKLCSVAGLRIGYAAANPQLINYIENAQSTFNVSNVAILFATEILKRPDLIETLIKEEEEGRNWLYSKLVEKGYEVQTTHANYILFKPRTKSKRLVELLKEDNVWVRDYSKGVLEGWLRVSTGSQSVMQLFYDALSKYEAMDN